MSLDSLLSTNAVTIVEPTVDTSRYRHPVSDFDTPDTSTTTTGWLTQVSTSEQVGPRTVVTTGWKLYLATGTDIAASYKVQVDGAWYEVDGDPETAQTPRGSHHIECVLRRVTDLRPGPSAGVSGS